MEESFSSMIFVPINSKTLAELLNERNSPFDAEDLSDERAGCYSIGRKNDADDLGYIEPIYQLEDDVKALYDATWSKGWTPPQCEIQFELTSLEAIDPKSTSKMLLAYLMIKEVPFLAAAADLTRWRLRLLAAYDPCTPELSGKHPSLNP